MIYSPKHFNGSDSDRLQAAVDAAAAVGGGKVVVGRRVPDESVQRDYWLLERALLLPANVILVLDNCRLKLADTCRDNMIRSANCGIGISKVEPLHNIHIVGIGEAVLEGADRPRASGDGAKSLSADNARERGGSYIPISYGTDALDATEKQSGDWRNIGILLAEVHNFSITGIKLVDTHCWGISLEWCSFGTIRDLRFASIGGRVIDGKFRVMLNQDGLDLRQGCHDITIDGISGSSGDDLVALTAIRRWQPQQREAGSLDSTMVGGAGWGDTRDDVYNIIIRNVRGTAGGHHVVRFLNNGGIVMRNILIDGVVGTATAERPDRAVIVVGDQSYGGAAALGDTRGFMVSNVCGQARHLVEVRGTLSDSVFTNLLYTTAQGSALSFPSGSESGQNIKVCNDVCID
ncbi:MAG: hypothetical protein GX230_09490 [Lentisphaerae bacterium]|jgi:polygalacturonase|nr:hypothetical protein [Lentisphaerota bacterium]